MSRANLTQPKAIIRTLRDLLDDPKHDPNEVLRLLDEAIALCRGECQEYLERCRTRLENGSPLWLAKRAATKAFDRCP